MTFSEYIEKLRGKRIAVIGIGVSNTPLIRKLLVSGCRVTACDKSEEVYLGKTVAELRELGAELRLGPGYLDRLDADVIFRTPGLRPDVPPLLRAQANGSVLTSEMEVFFRVCPCPMIGVTGSDGKTTTTTILSELLKSAGKTVHVGGNIGAPLLCDADAMSPGDVCVLELSSFQLMTMKDSPQIAVITNLAPNHLDIHRDMEEYIDAKKNIFRYQTPSDRFVTNLDNDITRPFAKEAKGQVLLFSRKKSVDNGVFLNDSMIYSAHNGHVRAIMDSRYIFLPGDHNIENYMAAFAATQGLVPPEIQSKVAETFQGVEHRIEFVRKLAGVSYYNDSIASSPSRTIAGLKSFPQKVILIAGGKDKGVPFDGLGVEINKHVKGLVLTGYTAGKLYDAVTGAPNYDPSLPIQTVDDFRDAVLAAAAMAKSGDVVILSPACTSFDRFRNFMERGNRFKEIVNGL